MRKPLKVETEFPRGLPAGGPDQRFLAPSQEKALECWKRWLGPGPPSVSWEGSRWAALGGPFPHPLPCCHPPRPALELLKNAIGKAGYTDKVVIGMDVAASEFFRSGKYDLDFKSPDDPSRYITPDELANLYKSFIKDYPGECPLASCGRRFCHCPSRLLGRGQRWL